MGATVLVNIDVDDLERAVAFYTAAFGLTVGRRFGAFAVELNGGTVPIYLLLKPDGSPANAVTGERRSYARHWTPVHLDFVVAAAEELDQAQSVTERIGHERDLAPCVRCRLALASRAGGLGAGQRGVQVVDDEIATG